MEPLAASNVFEVAFTIDSFGVAEQHVSGKCGMAMLLATAVFPDVEAALAVNMSKDVGAKVLAVRYLAVTRHSFDKILKAVRSRLVFLIASGRNELLLLGSA